jgi:hypothetical protein
MTQRIERILTKLAQQRAPELLALFHDGSPQSLKQLARKLAGYELLIVMANVPNHLQPEYQRHLQNWANAISRFHDLLAQTLFPSYAHLKAMMADDQQPPVLVFEARIAPMVEVMAGYLIPYVASRQSYTTIPEDELRTLVETMLRKLHAHDQPLPIYDILIRDAMEQTRRLIRLPLQYIALTDFDEPLFVELSKPATLPKAPSAMPTPPEPVVQQAAQHPVPQAVQSTPQPVAQPAAQPTPEAAPEFKLEYLEDEDKSQTPTDQMFVHPIFLNNSDRTDHHPPVPPPPKRPKKPSA